MSHATQATQEGGKDCDKGPDLPADRDEHREHVVCRENKSSPSSIHRRVSYAGKCCWLAPK